MNIDDAPEISGHNADAISKSDQCGCYFCIRICKSEDVIDYVDNDTSGLCPHCGMDALLPGVISPKTLEAANIRWFCNPVHG